MSVLVLETAPQAYYPHERELVHKQSIRNDRIDNGGIFQIFGKKNY
jgi:hypothetical protein